MTDVLSLASRINSLPGVGFFAKPANRIPDAARVEGYLRCQALAQRGAAEVAGLLREGWTERRAADLLDSWLRDYGVKAFFHASFAWFGERTRFTGVRRRFYHDFLPTRRVLREGEIYILDVAPILDGYISDIGYTGCFGENADFAAAKAFLDELRRDLPAMFAAASARGGLIWHDIDARIRDAGYDNIHALYPFSVLGHRVHQVPTFGVPVGLLNFGWQSYWSLLSRGLFGQLLNFDHAGDLTGLWAIEPHIGGPGFGAKFEEILLVTPDGARWISDPSPAQV